MKNGAIEEQFSVTVADEDSDSHGRYHNITMEDTAGAVPSPAYSAFTDNKGQSTSSTSCTTSISGNAEGVTKDQCGSFRKLRIAVAGCAHGEMETIYEVLAEIEKSNGYNFDLLICCGDYQAVRNYGDLHHMHVSEKYRSLQTFYKYYSLEKKAPILTIFVGGNHEASGYLSELPNGGWVAPDIYYMGFANVIRFAGLRIAGLSGIYNGREFNRGHHERPPYTDPSEVISTYHVRNVDVWRLRQLRADDDDYSSNPIDIMISHDWPSGVIDYGDKDQLLRAKPFFRDDIVSGKLGNPSTMQLLYALELDIAPEAELKLSYDPVWLAILKNTDSFTNSSRSNTFLPSISSDERWDFRPTESELAAISKLGDLSIPKNFRHTAPPLKSDSLTARLAKSSTYYRNPQTAEFCSWLGICDLNKMLADVDPTTVGIAHYLVEGNPADTSEIVIDEDIFADGEDFAIDRRPVIGGLEDFTTPELTLDKDEHGGSSSTLQDFTPPKISPKTSTPVRDGAIILKRRKLDIPEED